MKYIELLAPAKDMLHGKAAIDCGADAVYIGPSMFGARNAAGNSLNDIEELVKYAHFYRCKVHATVNTLLFDSEIAQANQLIHQLYNIGVDAIIIQDMGLLNTPLPPIALHASTQTFCRTVDDVKFMESIGMERVILPRETSLKEIREIRKQSTIELETFVHGALCVCYSGQCYLSQYLVQRSGNRGMCSQPCRTRYDLVNEKGETLVANKHLLSLKDFSAATNLEQMIDAGITSFKIEGRLKDLAYVKNCTAFYRQLLDSIIEKRSDCKRSSSGKSYFTFTPDIDRTFNRGFTDYFLRDRQPLARFDTAKSLGKRMGIISHAMGRKLTVESTEPLSPGDGICFFDRQNNLQGVLVNQVDNKTIVANKNVDCKPGSTFWRNNDHTFEKQLSSVAACRKVGVAMTLCVKADHLALTMIDDEDNKVTVQQPYTKTLAQNGEPSYPKQLAKLGTTPFELVNLSLPKEALFIPISLINNLRREACGQLYERRIASVPARLKERQAQPSPYPSSVADYRTNITNQQALKFYQDCGVTSWEYGVDKTNNFTNKAVMTCKYCLRYELKQCLKHKCNGTVTPNYRQRLFLRNNNSLFELIFDCQKCEMQIKPVDEKALASKP